ncbi:hypothetical protein EHQ58_04100 [Leptospira ognonensis]|uniref:Glycosyltransferase RgtA/B/C/D-like domain-containing protein n=1 Tax=Leptospira ognonensis TaxID=2484945 RepID=A0A4R9KAI4_9LEPT|nr:hypothetical protein [Leptospira ognonensis]TGL61804.1 hypothetical protein EHQ58_04100 [Leptospira ognonensis]
MREQKPISIPAFLFSILVLALGFTIFSLFRPFPISETEWEFLANLRSLTEEGGFYSAREPLPFMILLFWKKISGLNYIPAFLSLAGIFYSLFLHLFLLLLRRDSWGRNHYLFLFLAAFLPFSYVFPTSFFPETVCLVFILLVFLTFRFEKISDLLVFPSLTLLAFFSSFSMFYLGFSFFVIFSGIRGARKQAKKTSVFYKKRNIPFIFVTSYLIFFVISLFLISYFNFLGETSASTLFGEWVTLVKFLFFPLLVLGIGHVLLKTEKELNTYTASVVTLILVGISIFFIYRDLTKSENEPWEIKIKSITKAYGQASILKSDPIYLEKEFSYALYFVTKTKTHYIRLTDENPKSFMYVTGIWSQDVLMIQKALLGKKGGRLLGLVSLGEDSILIQKSLLERLKTVATLDFIVKKSNESWDSLPFAYGYHHYMKSLQDQFGFKSFY